MHFSTAFMLPEVVAILPKCSTCSCNLGKRLSEQKIESVNSRAGGEEVDCRRRDHPSVCAMGVFFEGKTHGGEKYHREGSE